MTAGGLRRVGWRLPVLIYLVSLGVYAAASGGRLRGPSQDNHYVHLADAILHGRLHLEGAPPHENDWARVTELRLTDGRRVRGAFLRVGGADTFRTTRGERLEIPPERIAEREDIYYVSFPWFPAILMLPFVAIWGMAFNDVLFTVVLGALNPVLVFLVLRRLGSLRLSDRSVSDDLWLTAMFAFGTVYFYSTVLGQVWYTAHVVGVAITALYLYAALEGRHPVWAGLLLGLGFVTRTPIPFSFPILLGEVLRRNLAPGDDPAPDLPLLRRARAYLPRVRWRPVVRQLAGGAVPAVAVLAVALVLNQLRFDSPTEFGHYYLNVRWTERIQRWGLFNYHFLSRNLAVMFVLLPRLYSHPPYVKVSWHGLSVFFTTPMFAHVLRRPPRRSPITPWLYLACAFPMVIHLLYQNSGWVQFGYRFLLDYVVYLVALLAVGGYRLGWLARGLIVWGIAVNTFGAVTFGRYWQFYWDGMFPTQ